MSKKTARRWWQPARTRPRKVVLDMTSVAEETTTSEAALEERLIEVYIAAFEERTRENRGYGLLDFEREAVVREARELYSGKVGAV